MVIAPTITIRIEMTIATIGRRIKKFDITQLPFRRNFAGLGTTSRSILELFPTLNDNMVIRIEAVVNHPHRPNFLAGFDCTNTRLVVGTHNCDLITSLNSLTALCGTSSAPFFMLV